MTLKTDLLSARIDASLVATAQVRDRLSDVETIVDLIIETLSGGGTIWTAGNGGSAAQALHLAEELIGRYRRTRRALASASLVADSAALTCIANDFGFEHVFSRQIEGLAKPGDLIILLSTSGNSPNIVAAIEAAARLNVHTVALLGGDGGRCGGTCSASITIDQTDSAFVQDAHQLVIHLICEAVDAWAHETDTAT